MVKRNPNLARLNSGYLFPEINKRKKAFLQDNPDAKLISLGIGDTTEPLYPHITQGLVDEAIGLGTKEKYSGYGFEQGNRALREKIAAVLYQGRIGADDVFVSDGAKCDIGRLQTLFGASATIAVQDPAYPVYVDSSVIIGQKEITYLPCLAENSFFPDLKTAARTDLIYFCSPNNPTGATATFEQLKELVSFAKKNRSIIIYDAAYAIYIRNGEYPRSIYDIEGANEVAIEVNSFSKMAGFTGVRLGWTIVPEKLVFEDGTPVKKDWNRIVSTIFNGASNIAQAGGLSALDDEGLQEMELMVSFYLENAAIIKREFAEKGYRTYGGVHAPYLWVHFPGKSSWDVFNDLLAKAHIVATPGSGFGKAGEGFMRFSAFGHRENIEEAAVRLRHFLT